jgi:hypothetical protein
MVCCFDLKKSRNDWRISALVIKIRSGDYLEALAQGELEVLNGQNTVAGGLGAASSAAVSACGPATVMTLDEAIGSALALAGQSFALKFAHFELGVGLLFLSLLEALSETLSA